MKGYILNLFRYATYPSDLKPYMRNYLSSRSNISQPDTPMLLVYGDYDRLSIEPVVKFSRYRDVDTYAQQWLGARQTILLYPLKNPSIQEEVKDLLGEFCALHIANETAQIGKFRNFLILTMLTINPVLHSYNDFSKILSLCEELIKRQIKNCGVDLIEPANISYQVYGSFSSSELAIVWTANQYVDAFRLIEILRYSSFEYKAKDGRMLQIFPFISLYSIVAQPMTDSSRIDSTQIIQGSADLKFVFQDGVSSPTARRDFFTKVFEGQYLNLESSNEKAIIQQYSVGEYDYSIKIPANILCNPHIRLFHQGQALHWAQDEMHKYIYSSCVQLHFDTTSTLPDTSDISNTHPMRCQEFDSVLPEEIEDLSQKIEMVKCMIYGQKDGQCATDFITYPSDSNKINLFDVYRKSGLRSIIKERIPETDGLCDSLDLLYSDFVNNCSNLTNSSWSSDLVTQFVSIIDYLANQFYINQRFTQNSCTLFSNIKSVCEIFIQMVYHIAQSRRTIFVVPSCHLRYMGQYDMILHAYYGWEKYLLDLAYSFPHQNGVQPILIPILTIDVIPEINTKIYKVQKHYCPRERISDIFSINMPLGAMTDFLRYAMTMSHETAHLIIPFDRDRRNQVFGMLFFSELVANLLLAPIRIEYWKDTPPIEDYLKVFPVIMREIIVVIYNHMRTFFLEHIHSAIMKSYMENPDRCPPWEEYLISLRTKLALLLKEQAGISLVFEALGEYNALFRQVISETIDKILWNSRQSEVPFIFSENFCNELKEKLINLLKRPLSPQQKDSLLSLRLLLNFHRDTLLSESNVLSQAYREACQDLFMIRVFQLELVDYLVFLERQRNDNIALDYELPKAEILRIAMICDYLLTKRINLGEPLPTSILVIQQFDDLAPVYVKLLMQVPEMRTRDGVRKETLFQRLKCCFQSIRKGLELYYGDYDMFRPLILDQLKSADPFMQTSDIRENIARNGMHQFYIDWKDAIQNADNESDEAELKMYQKIFSINVALIQRYQAQPSFDSLAHKLEERGHCDEGTAKV